MRASGELMALETHDQDRIPLLTFALGPHTYALFVADVVEVAAMVALTPLVDAHPAVLGLANRQGQALPMLALRPLRGLPPRAINAETLFIVARYRGAPGERRVGLVVDAVHQVDYMQPDELLSSPINGTVVSHVVSQGERLVQVLNLPALLDGVLNHQL